MRIMALLVVEQEFGQRAGQFGFSDAGGPQKDETADGPVGILQSRAGAHDGFRNRLHRFILPDHALVQLIFQMQQLLHFAFEQLRNRNAGPAADHWAMSSSSTSSLSSALAGLLFGQARFLGLELAFELGELAVFQLGGAVQIVLRARPFRFPSLVCSICSRSVTQLLHGFLFGLPLRFERVAIPISGRRFPFRSSSAGPWTRCRILSSEPRARFRAA